MAKIRDISVNGTSYDIETSELTEAVSGTSVTKALSPNVFYTFGTLSSLTYSLLANSESGVVSEYHFQFTSGGTPTTITHPAGLSWAGGNVPTINANKKYEISIVNNLAIVIEF